MLWEEVFFERNLDHKDIVKALAHVFRVEEQRVALQFGTFTANLEDHISVFCVFNIIRGDFPICLAIAPLQHQHVLHPEQSESYRIIGQLCDLLDSPALVQDDFHYDRETWVLIRGEGNYQFVSVDFVKSQQPLDLFELEIIHESYKFSKPVSLLESTLGNFIVSSYFDDDVIQKQIISWTKSIRSYAVGVHEIK